MIERRNELAFHNDHLRRFGLGGRVVATQGVISLSETTRSQLMQAIVTFTAFDQDNDPYGERDFGLVELEGQKYYWKIDYYDRTYEGLSPDPLDLSVTRRVMTVMRADEY